MVARLACIYLPAFPLQMEVRERPELAGRAVAILGADRPELLACSRAAFHAGIRPGMRPSQARVRVADLIVVQGSPRRWRDEIVSLAAALGALAGQVDLTEALRGEVPASQPVLFLQVPSGQRSERFGRRLLEVLSDRGLRGRVGIAPDRFTSRTAARVRSGDPLTIVRRGRAAEFLAPLPIDLLPLRDEVRTLLHAAGVHTLGQFAALPPPSEACRAAGAVDYQELARGNGPSDLCAMPTPLSRMPARQASPAAGRSRSGYEAGLGQLDLAS